jgi:hypothetical protein
MQTLDLKVPPVAVVLVTGALMWLVARTVPSLDVACPARQVLAAATDPTNSGEWRRMVADHGDSLRHANLLVPSLATRVGIQENRRSGKPVRARSGHDMHGACHSARSANERMLS